MASLFGASLLFPDALPLLPHEINRNVSSFLALYKNHFPFLQSRELPKGGFEQPLPEEWTLWSEPVGANTTLIVEKLIERQQPLSPVQATLFALGIHEATR